MTRLSALVAVSALLLAASCGGEGASSVTPPADRAYLFDVRGVPEGDGRFVAVTSDPGVIAKLEAELAKPAAERALHIDGPIARGNGGHNLGWSWHFEPGRWDVVDISVEVCDGTPRMVESDPSYWVDKVGRFCPWASYVVASASR